MHNSSETSPRSLPKNDRKELRAKLPEAVILMATSKQETVARFAEMIAMAETVPGLAHLTIQQISNHVIRLDPEYLRGEVEPESDSPVAPVLFKILEMLHFTNMYYQKNYTLGNVLTEDQQRAARLAVYQNIEQVTTEFIQKTLTNQAKKEMGKKKAERKVSKLFENLQNLKEKMIYASDVLFKWNGEAMHKFLRGDNVNPSPEEVEAYTQKLLARYSDPSFAEHTQKAEWLVSFGVAQNGKIGISRPLSIQVDFGPIPEDIVRNCVDLKANTGIPLLELATTYGNGFTLGIQGDEESRIQIPYQVAHRLVVSKLPVNLEMLSELLDPHEQHTEIMTNDDLVFDNFNLVTLRGISQLGNLAETNAA